MRLVMYILTAALLIVGSALTTHAVYGSALFYIDDFYLYDRALSAAEVSGVMDGKLLPVEPKSKLSTTWGRLKTSRD